MKWFANLDLNSGTLFLAHLGPSFSRFDDLDVTVGRRIVKRIRWLADNLDSLTPIPLAGDLTGLYKLRVGDYRVIYEIRRELQVVVIQAVGHRSEVYRHLS